MRPHTRLCLGLALTLLCGLAACSDEAGPSPPPITLTLPSPAEGRLVACTACQEPSTTLVIELPVAVRDAMGPGGTVERLTTILTNRSRDIEIGRNIRPNSSHAFPSTTLPSGGQLVLQAGLTTSPPPPRDELILTVQVRLTDGREVQASAPLVTLPAT
jgi:hypothetical protein